MIQPKQLYWRLVGDNSQDRAILRLLRKAGAVPSWNILEVGCGYGRNLRLMRNTGLSATGVELNENIISTVRADGLRCVAPDDPSINHTAYDVLLMSHIIEHFEYKSLFEMMNRYLSLLRPGGFVIIATPMLGSRFYDNFDHVKPYTPIAIEEVFGRRGMQVQFQSDHELELVDLWLRRRPHLLQLFPSLLRRKMSPAKAFLGSVNVILQVVHLLSFRLIGNTDGWVGLYRKVN